MKILLTSLFLLSACATTSEAKKPKPKMAMKAVAPAQVFCQKFHDGKGCVTCDPNSASAKFYYCVATCDDPACKAKQ